eukprot:s10200_g2.t1
MQGVPAFLRPDIRQAYTFSLRALRDAHSRAGEAQQTRAWKLFLLVPRLLLFRVRVTGSTGREALLQRVRDFLAGRWTALLAAARDAADQLGPAPTAHADDDAASLRRREAACAHVRRGEVSRGRTVLTAAALAPGTEDTFAALSDPARRPPAHRNPRRRARPPAQRAGHTHRRRRRSGFAFLQARDRCRPFRRDVRALQSSARR